MLEGWQSPSYSNVYGTSAGNFSTPDVTSARSGDHSPADSTAPHPTQTTDRVMLLRSVSLRRMCDDRLVRRSRIELPWWIRWLATMLLAISLFTSSGAQAAGEPAADFLTRLRAAGYYDTAITYLDRLDLYPGVDPEFSSAVILEKAQTYIDAAVNSRSPKARDEFFRKAESELGIFLNQGSHPRQAEARLLLGKLQMVRASQLMSGKPDDAKRASARESYLAAAKTFDTIVESLRETLKEMQGAKIDADKDPKAAARRDQYRGEFLQGLMSSGEARQMAAQTYKNPSVQGKKLLQEALVSFEDLSEKYSAYVQGAIAMLNRGLVQEELGKKDEALDSYLRMLESPDAEPLRDAKIQATSGVIRLSLAEQPPKFQAAIDRGQGMIDSLRMNERRLPNVAQLQVDLAKAYLEKAKDKDHQKPGDLKRAESDGRQLLIKVSKLPGAHVAEAKKLLADMGIDSGEQASALPTAEDPKSLSDAIEKSRELLQISESLSESLAVLQQQPDPSEEIKAQTAEIETQLTESRALAIQILRRGLSMVNFQSDVETANQARQFLAYLLYQDKRFREAMVVGGFLAKSAPAKEIGLKGGMLAINSLQMLLIENPENESLITHLASLGKYLTETWPEDSQSSNAQGVLIKLALRNEKWDEARGLIEKLPAGPEQASLNRLLGQLLWNRYIQTRQAGDAEQADNFLKRAETDLRAGLEGIAGGLADVDAMRSALILAKIYLRRDDVEQAAMVLNHPKFGPSNLVETLGTPDENFASDLYSTELQVIVAQMTSASGDTKTLMDRATQVMEELRASVSGANAQARLTGIYMRMARDIREQLDTSGPDQKTKLIQAFRVFLQQMSTTTEDDATLQWIGQTLMQLAEASMQAADTKAVGQAAELLTTASATFERLKNKSTDVPLAIDFQLGRAQRLLGDYKAAVDTLDQLLRKKPMMLDAQMEAAHAYEQWAGILPAKFVGKAYEAALSGARPDAKKQNVIWGWGKVSQLTSRDPQFREMFFESRYHVALCHYQWGKATKNKALIEKSKTDITKVAALYPELGSPQQRLRFDQLLKRIQKDLGQPPVGL